MNFCQSRFTNITKTWCFVFDTAIVFANYFNIIIVQRQFIVLEAATTLVYKEL